jgi:hypothetical protein
MYLFAAGGYRRVAGDYPAIFVPQLKSPPVNITQRQQSVVRTTVYNQSIIQTITIHHNQSSSAL